MILLKNGQIIQAGNHLQAMDLLIEGSQIVKISPHIEAQGEWQVLDLSGKLVTAGFIDVHVHLREPGFTDKETIKTGSRAAIRGGYTTIFAMPNVNPSPDTPDGIQDLLSRAAKDSPIDIGFFAPITMGEKGIELTDIRALKEAGAIALSDDGKGVQSNDMMLQAMKLAQATDLVISAHCEDESVLNGGYIHEGAYSQQHGHKGIMRAAEDIQAGRDILLAGETGAKYHICHMSSYRTVDLLELGRKWGCAVSGEVTPHHLLLTQDDLREDGRFKMNPPLRDRMDQDRLIQGLEAGIIEVIATDHAPHTEIEKSRGLADSPFGITGLETSFALLYTYLVKPGKISLETVINALTKGPARVFSLDKGTLQAGAVADITVIDLERDYTIESANHESKGKNTPFDQWRVFGKIETVMKAGRILLRDGEFTPTIS